MTELKIINGKINFHCKMERCEHCCCGVFNGLTDKLANMDHRPFDEIVLTKEDFDNLVEAGRSDLIEETQSEITGRKYYRMSLNEDGSCKALRNGRCSINRFKPTLCSAFPFYFDMFSGLCAIMCEGFSDDCVSDFKDCEDSLKAATKMYEYWLEFYRTDRSKEEQD